MLSLTFTVTFSTVKKMSISSGYDLSFGCIVLITIIQQLKHFSQIFLLSCMAFGFLVSFVGTIPKLLLYLYKEKPP
jgi:hypothetical protein